jgi:hypothetical protein
VVIFLLVIFVFVAVRVVWIILHKGEGEGEDFVQVGCHLAGAAKDKTLETGEAVFTKFVGGIVLLRLVIWVAAKLDDKGDEAAEVTTKTVPDGT